MKFEVSINVEASIELIWRAWTDADHIKEWFRSSEDWFVPACQVELGENLEFTIYMAAKDGSSKFPFKGTFTKISPFKYIQYFTEDGRQVDTYFLEDENHITIHQEIEAELSNALDVQKAGWEQILQHFKIHVESK